MRGETSAASGRDGPHAARAGTPLAPQPSLRALASRTDHGPPTTDPFPADRRLAYRRACTLAMTIAAKEATPLAGAWP